MTKYEFEIALEKGFGRAYQYIEKNGDKLVCNQLLQACIRNLSYDPQCEDSRSEWLMSLINLSKNRNFYFQKIIEAISGSDDYYDISQLFKLCKLIAKQGNESAKLAIYEKFDKQEFYESYLGGEEIVQLDGLTGLLHVANVIGKRLKEDSEYWDTDIVYSEVTELFGKNETDDFLFMHAKENQYVAAHPPREKPEVMRRIHLILWETLRYNPYRHP